MHTHLVIIFSLFVHYVTAQEVLVDDRDGKTYRTVTIGSLTWMVDHLQLVTPDAHCPHFSQEAVECEEVNFYSYRALSSLCPTGWRIPTLKDWEAYIATISAEKAYLFEKNKRLFRVDFMDGFNLFENNPLRLTSTGRTQGNKRKEGDYIDFWTVNPDKPDDRFHMHLTPHSIVGHVHKHHVNERKEENNRKFAVKCVCDVR